MELLCRVAISNSQGKENSVTSAAIKTSKPDADHQEFEISVNFKPVRMNVRTATGMQVKEAAITQGVNIRPDFVLIEDKGNGQRKIIGDSDEVHLHPGSKFEAIPHDDNS
jgi:hypothetical protein